jgi:anti-anti-sigma factor
MQIEKSSRGDLLELTVQGRLDNDSSVHFREEIESSAREGWHRILVDLSGVTYLSSSGIAALLTAKQRLESLHGFFGIHNPIPQVEQVLRTTRVLDRLRCDPQTARTGPSVSATTSALSSTTRFAQEGGIELEIYSLNESPPLTCRIFGHPQSLSDSKSAEPRPRDVSFGRQAFGLGLGALGHHSESSQARHGEFLAVAGAVAQSPQTNGGLPDYLLAAGDFIPAAQVLYGVKCEGDLPVLIRFSPSETDAQIGLSQILSCGLKQTGSRRAGFVILANCAGLVGAQLRRWPAKIPQDTTDRFAVPGIRDWLSFSAEQIHRRNLVLIVGIAASRPVEKPSPLDALLRPMEPNAELTGHFHAAVFPDRPLKKRVLPLQRSVTDLFESGTIEDVLHLLRDDRPVTGLGESGLFGGACWLGPIEDVIALDDNA